MDNINSSWGNAEPEFSEGNQQDQLSSRFETARYAASAPGGICQFLGVVIVAFGGFALFTGNVAGAAASIGGGASMATLGSIATSSKRTAALAELQAWVVVQNSKKVQ